MAGRLIFLCLMPSMLLASPPAAAPAEEQPAPHDWQRDEPPPPPESITLTAEQVFTLYAKMRQQEQQLLEARDAADKWRRKALSCRGREVS